MLDFFTITTRGGLVLWSKAYSASSTSPINHLIQEVLIEERSSTQIYYKDNYALKWTFVNDLDLIFIAVYPKTLGLTYIDTLLKVVSTQFSDLYGAKILRKSNGGIPQLKDWDLQFEALLQTVEDQDASVTKQPRKFEETVGYANTLAFAKSKPGSKSPLLDEDEFRRNVELLKKKTASPRMGGRKGKGAKSPVTSPVIGSDDSPKKKVKEGRKWDGKISAKDAKSLDYSNSDISEVVKTDRLVDQSGMGQHSKDGTYSVADLEASDDAEDSYSSDDSDGGYTKISGRSLQAKKPVASNGLLSFFKNMTGQKEMTEESLEPIMRKMKEHLINKNVAADIAQHLCDSIAKGLVGQTLGSFKSVQAHVKQNMELALKRILTPKTSVDLLRDIAQAQAEKRPYTIVFIGVNGVGKSTNLSKTAFWLLQNNMKVLIAACDTFRSGAVEQLRVHVRNLKALEQNAVVDLYEKGYGKDSATIAKEAISSAKTTGHDVVLIDTAGRMQDNDPLMRALAKLVTVNNPDKIIFVGEALVGNEAVDQLTKFNAALKDFSGMANPRHIDGMILTKFDTIDDKVGAALSMTYTTGQPILFVGTGQTYTDLKNMKVSHVVASLLRE
ncbi:SRP54-type protein [Lobosporangium transversale]|uniref:SRP54-type protein n=1 Tax=Lobosporangium transversale TaxID=64571 RepID=A0A1Y2GZY6_9FUNG|nr:SRP54-type protein [Lobosporangium transversale]ORZ27354.1 SRP54-type protein [Lobosporangium transversale]|eukprot:XP_021885081.1 SRP54-type protein [Lobosporangium transversale]